MDTIPELGSKLSIVTKDNIRWEGVFATLNSNVSTLSLTDVRSFTVEGEEVDHKIEHKLFYGRDIKAVKMICNSQPCCVNAVESKTSTSVSVGEIPSTSGAGVTMEAEKKSVSNQVLAVSAPITKPITAFIPVTKPPVTSIRITKPSATFTQAPTKQATSNPVGVSLTESALVSTNSLPDCSISPASSMPTAFQNPITATEFPSTQFGGIDTAVLTWLSNLQMQHQEQLLNCVQQQHQNMLNAFMPLLTKAVCVPETVNSTTNSLASLVNGTANMNGIVAELVEMAIKSSSESADEQEETRVVNEKKRVTYKEPEFEQRDYYNRNGDYRRRPRNDSIGEDHHRGALATTSSNWIDMNKTNRREDHWNRQNDDRNTGRRNNRNWQQRKNDECSFLSDGRVQANNAANNRYVQDSGYSRQEDRSYDERYSGGYAEQRNNRRQQQQRRNIRYEHNPQYHDEYSYVYRYGNNGWNGSDETKTTSNRTGYHDERGVNSRNFKTFHDNNGRLNTDFDFERGNEYYKKFKTRLLVQCPTVGNGIQEFQNEEQQTHNTMDENKNGEEEYKYYNKNVSFFDAVDVDEHIDRGLSYRDVNELNNETFGTRIFRRSKAANKPFSYKDDRRNFL